MKIQTFDYSVDLLQAILWQYNDAINLQSLLTQKQDWYNLNQRDFWNDWYTNVFNLLTANFFGLSVWSKILNLPLFVPVNPEDPGKPIWGFNEYTVFPTLINTYQNFENGNFSTRGEVVVLTLEEQRFILRLRYFQLANRGDIPDINSFLQYLFATTPGMTGTSWALDGLDMTMTYIFTVPISEALASVLIQYDLLPRPAGVGLKYIVLTGTIFGFGMFYQNYENGNFIPESF